MQKLFIYVNDILHHYNFDEQCHFCFWLAYYKNEKLFADICKKSSLKSLEKVWKLKHMKIVYNLLGNTDKIHGENAGFILKKQNKSLESLEPFISIYILIIR